MAEMTVCEYLAEHFPKQLLKIIYELEFKECQIWISQVLVFHVQNTKYYWGGLLLWTLENWTAEVHMESLIGSLGGQGKAILNIQPIYNT